MNWARIDYAEKYFIYKITFELIREMFLSMFHRHVFQHQNKLVDIKLPLNTRKIKKL